MLMLKLKLKPMLRALRAVLMANSGRCLRHPAPPAGPA